MPVEIKYRWREILNKSASRKRSAIKDDKRHWGHFHPSADLVQTILLGKKQKKSHSNVTELCICIHSTMETVRMLFSGDLCISVTAALPQYAEVAHLDRSYPGFHILNGSWDTREFSRSGSALALTKPSPASMTKLHVWLQATLRSSRCPFSIP